MMYKLTGFSQVSEPLTSALSNFKQALLRGGKTNSRAYDDCPYLTEDGNSENIRAIAFL